MRKKFINKFVLSAIVLIIISFILRTLFLSQGSLSFHYDMARDAFVAEQIWKNHDFKILGPPTSTPGLYHGVGYYYLISPFYALGQGDPLFVAYFLSLLNSLAVLPIMLLARDIFKSYKWSLLAGILYTVSYEATQYGPWISNPSPAMLTVTLFFYSLWKWYQKDRWGLPLAFLFAGLSMQFQFFLAYLFLVLVIFGIVFKPLLSRRQLFFSVIFTLLTTLSFWISFIKFNTLGQTAHSILGLLVGNQYDFRIPFSTVAVRYLNQFLDIFINNFFPVNIFIGGLLGIICIFFARKNNFIIFCLFSSVLIFLLGGHTSVYATIGTIAPAILALILFLQAIGRWNKIILFCLISLIFTTNLYMIFKINPRGQLAMVIPKDMVLKEQLNLIDSTYKIAKRQPFSVNTLTLPLWTNTTWSYLYHYYGQKKYGYIPTFYGRDQAGIIGGDAMEKVDYPQGIAFFILEPGDGIPSNFYKDEIDLENSRTVLEDELLFQSIRLQVRKPKESSNSGTN